MTENDPYRLPGDVNPYAPPEAELVSRAPAYGPAGLGRPLEPFSVDAVWRRSWRIYREKLGSVMGIVIGGGGLAVAYQIVGNLVMSSVAAANGAAAPPLAVNAAFVVSATVFQWWLLLGMARALLMMARGQDVEFAELFRGGRFFLRYVGASILYWLVVAPVALVGLIPAFIGAALLAREQGPAGVVAIVIGVITTVILVVFVSVRLLQYQYVLVDHDCGVLDSLRGSYEITRGHVVEMVGISLLSGLVAALGILACFVGLLFTYPLGMLIMATAYALLAGDVGYGLGPKARTDLEFLDFES